MKDHRIASVKRFAVAYSASVAHEGFEEFAQRVRPMLVALAKRLCGQGGIDPEDLAQEALVRALVHHAALSAQPEPVYRAWLCRALTNHFLDQCRKRRTELLEQERRDIRLVREDVGSPDAVTGEMWERISDADLLKAIARLPNARVREAFELHAKGLRYRAIAQRMGVPEGTVGSWLFQARKELRELLMPLTDGGGDA
ncbi:RNA polymerase sigma factor [Myxococcus faecalis]|jgi:RNA polymerase sigma-70 factor (ECF subfamily)|uniref:RNA polymerase sigma factor n=1 Tax=Myxococcus TaxID=32 RepID=UPI001CC0EDD0|nr:RNA polymerase sigma factor [Myxococcus sp. XM-1-1-1]MBZ4407097.1 RNA polymerase sigma factor [Myxococcus sp. XM-1-1-1]BDT36134.1 RNA polymerase sigma factor [Myxococcus sp. MH1]